MYKIFTCIALICATLTASAQNLDELTFGTDSTLDIISWNIEWFPKNEATTADYVGQIINNLNADIYALQEIEDTTLLKETVNALGEYECFFESSWYGGLAYVYNTNTIQLIDQYEIYTSEPYWNAFPRAPQLMEFSYLGEVYYLINNHFKCCGDGEITLNDEGDEEFRRLLAVTYLKEYIDSILPEEKVLVVGDLNDILTDDASNNVFLPFLDDANNYTFTDMDIAQGSSANYSFPTWPSHLDHILITNELFDTPQQTETIKVDEYMMNWNDYDNNVSDHRPVGWRLHNPNTSSISPMQNVMAQYSTTKEYVEINFNTNLGGESITVYNFEGKLIEKYKIPNTSDKFRFSIANFSAGAYFFSCDQVNLFGKFIVQ